MKKIRVKSVMKRCASMLMILSLFVTGISFGPYSGPIIAHAAARHRGGDHRIVKAPKMLDLIELEGDEAKALKKQARSRKISKIGEYGELLTDSEKEFYPMLVGAISNHAPYGTSFDDAFENNAFTVNISKSAYDEYKSFGDDDSVFFQHVLEATIYDNIDKVEFVMCQYSGFQPYYDTTEDKYYVSAAAVAQYPYDYSAMNNKFMNAANRLLSSIPNGTTELEKEVYIHDALIDNVSYYRGKSTPWHICYTGYGALVEGSAVCDGYSQAFSYLLNKVNIDSFVVTGGVGASAEVATNNGHAWNRVKIDDDWYEVDSTWDDGNDTEDVDERHAYFNMTTDAIENLGSDSHLRVDPYIGTRMDEPKATGSKYKYSNLKEDYSELFGGKKAESIEIYKDDQPIENAQIEVGETLTVTAEVSPEDATNKYVKWISENTNIADVDGGPNDEGAVIKGISSGTVTITAVAGSDMSKTDTIEVLVVIPVTGLILDQTEATLKIGENVTLTATVSPSDADNKEVNWSSSNEAVATVDEEGTVTAISSGQAIITATSDYDEEKTATCTVTVPQITHVTDLTLDKTEATVKVGEPCTLTATIAPENADDKTVTWSSSNEAVAVVVDGIVTAISSGTAIITAVSNDNSDAKATCTIYTEVPVASLTLDKTSSSLSVGDTCALIAAIVPENADDKTVTWSSSNETVATVANGTVTAKNPGTAVITAVSNDNNNVKATCTVTVSAIPVIPQTTPVTGITLDLTKESMTTGSSITLWATVAPENADNKTVTWTSSNESVATVVDGKVTAKSPGQAIITAISNDNNAITASCEITVALATGTKIEFGEKYKASYLITNESKVKLFKHIKNKDNKTYKIPSSITVNGETYTVSKIGSKAFISSKYKKIVIPNTITVIEARAFCDCRNLKKVIIYGENLKTIGKKAFSNIHEDAEFTIYISGPKKYTKLVNKLKKAGAKNAKFKFVKRKA
ncbi:Ig-like domain-containing protein [Butyrivibrio sp. VCD2006]|uniref:Ig-like domain-containing protein n=1 Tax=Butyrivibrio sp. VCD2006 TaxID=1280664 RepID=UPI00041DDB60|nr:Ig-like domain-containing protein [Butyrivibrio sp. VCD2006]